MFRGHRSLAGISQSVQMQGGLKDAYDKCVRGPLIMFTLNVKVCFQLKGDLRERAHGQQTAEGSKYHSLPVGLLLALGCCPGFDRPQHHLRRVWLPGPPHFFHL